MQDSPSPLNPAFFLGLSHVYSLIAQSLLARIGIVEGVAAELPPESSALIEPILRSVEEAAEGEILELSSSKCREDLDEASRTAWARTLERFYDDNGYALEKDSLEPDHIAVQLAFIAYMLGEIAHSLSKGDEHVANDRIIVLHRFLTVHAMPTLSQCKNPVAQRIGEVVRLTLSFLRPMAIAAAKKKRSF